MTALWFGSRHYGGQRGTAARTDGYQAADL
jgi:hypothetical protein